MKIRYIDIKQNVKKYSLAYFLVTLIIIISFLLIKDIRDHRHEMLDQHKTVKEFFLNHKATLTDVNYIENWMTFRYVNKIFNIPEEYLKNKLDIQDKKYPNLPIGKYSKEKKLDPSIGLKQIKDSLIEFLKTHPLLTK